jgi:hypothetical protein
MSKAKRYQVDPVVSCRDEGADGAILFNPDTDATAVLNPTGRDLWGLLAEPRTAADLAAHLTATYDGVTPEQAAEDVAAFLQQLGSGFLVETEAR